MRSREPFLNLLEQLRAIAQEGLQYTKDPYDVDRYKALLALTAKEYAPLTGLPSVQIEQELRKSLGSITPKVGVDSAVFSPDNSLLVLQRSDDQTWCLPGGWVGVAETPLEAVIRETKEETGLQVRPAGIIDVAQKGPRTNPKVVNQINILYVTHLPETIQPVKLSHEHLAYQWINRVTKLAWHPGHERAVAKALAYIKNKVTLPPE